MTNMGHALVVDDKYHDGMLICNILLSQLIPCYFFQYDEKKLTEYNETNPTKLNGIRVVFQDLALTSPGEPGKSDYDAAVTTIESVVSENNGPWLLVTWSTWAGADSKLGERKAEEMFNHLRDNLPATQRPYAFISLDTKPQFTTHRNHSDVKPFTDIEPPLINELTLHINEKTSQNPATKALLCWEFEAVRAISETISEITSFIQPGNLFDSDLGSILREMALADIGQNIAPDNIKKGIKEVLSSILRDKIGATIEGLESFNSIDKERHNRLDNWKAKTNRIIHFEESKISPPLPPGSIINLSDDRGILPIGETNDIDFWKFLRTNFMQLLKAEKAQKDQIAAACTLIALDITPPCDHAQNKSPWSKYILGIKVPKTHVQYCDSTNKEIRGNKLLGEYLIKLPEMMSSQHEHYHFIFNSRLTFSLDSSQANERFKEKVLGRLREQILSDINSWLIRQTTRPGIVELR
ncbi:hypothetical protein SOP89_18055 [Pseudomonas siliginis]|uniref:hypothetical protein n=1 Tax=Pseudomonas TaxID=286 RepID=UPI0010BFF964|nr:MULTISPECIES: hypothetical protein [Pseudomonas]MEB2653278.1 hypothetical protein [Pseudomonas siliginis]TKJ77462.1 hypothetical protein PkoCFBP13504_23255 [Pseudomonas koreensis]